MDFFRAAISALAIVTVATPASALQFTMDFDGIPPANVSGEAAGISAVLGYYNGDPGLNRAGNQDWDVTFNAPSLAILAGAPGNFPPSSGSGESAVTSLDGVVQLDLSSGVFLSGLSLSFNSVVGATAPILDFLLDGTFVFGQTLTGCASGGSGGLCGWATYDLPSSALTNRTVNGIRIRSENNLAVFDDITLSTTGSVQPIPEPGSLGLAMLGLTLVSGLALRRSS